MKFNTKKNKKRQQFSLKIFSFKTLYARSHVGKLCGLQTVALDCNINYLKFFVADDRYRDRRDRDRRDRERREREREREEGEKNSVIEYKDKEREQAAIKVRE